MKKEQKIRVPGDIAIKKLEDIISIEIKSIGEFVSISNKIIDNLYNLDIPDDLKKELISKYKENVIQTITNDYIKNIIEHTKMLAYTKTLFKENKLYFFENNYGKINVMYIPYLIMKNDNLNITFNEL